MTNTDRSYRQTAQRHKMKNATHTCSDCGVKIDQHPLGRSAHDRLAIHGAIEHQKFLDRNCIGGACKTAPFVPRERRGRAI